MSAAPQEPAPASLAERAYLALRDRLVMLEIRPGEPIDDEEAARSLGVGRTPVREALKRLEADRLVVSYPRRGTFATGLDLADLANVSEVRMLLEPYAARRAAEVAPRATRVALTRLAAEVEALDITATDRVELMRWDVGVHRAVYRAANNPHLEDVLIRYDNLATRIHCMFIGRLSATALHVVAEHVGLLRAIAAGEADRADDLARRHVLGFEQAVRAVI